MNHSSVGDLASQIMEQGDPVPQAPATGLPVNSTDPLVIESQSSLDISQVTVPDDFMNSILGVPSAPVTPAPRPQPLVEAVAPAPVAPAPVAPAPVVQPLQEVNDLCTLVQEVRDLLMEVRGALVEMTTVGALGVNMAGPGKKKKKEEPEEVDPMKAMLQRIKKRKAY